MMPASISNYLFSHIYIQVHYIFVNLFPVYSAILAFIFLGERVFLYHIIGAGFVCAGIFIVVRN